MPKIQFGRDVDPMVGRATQFGQPNGNQPCEGRKAAQQRQFYRWVESVATEEELKAYAADKTNPAIRRNFVKAMLAAKSVDEHFALCNQTHGLPKQEIDVSTTPTTLVIEKS